MSKLDDLTTAKGGLMLTRERVNLIRTALSKLLPKRENG